MAKLYWRVKLEGKWTWRPLHVEDHFTKSLVERLKIQEGYQ